MKRPKSRSSRLSQEQLRIAWRLLAIYVFALIIPAITGTVLYLMQIRQVEGEILESRTNALELNKRIVESAILSIEDAVQEIRQDGALSELTSYEDPLSTNASLRVLDAYERSRMAFSVPNYVLEIHVYFKNPDLLLTLSDIFFDPRVYYKYFFQIPGQRYSEWIRELRTDAYVHRALDFATIRLDDAEREAVVLQSSLPYATRLKSVGIVIAYVDRRALEGLLETYLAGDDGFAFIEMLDGRRLASVGAGASGVELRMGRSTPRSGVDIQTVDGREYAVSYIRSSENQWVYASGTPVEVFFAQSRRIRIIFMGLLLLILLVGMPVVFFQVFGVSRPIARTSAVLRNGVVLSESINRDPFRFISDSVDELIKKDRSLRSLLEEQKPLVRGVILERLFRGDFRSEAEARAFLEHFGIAIASSRSMVVCVVIEGYFDVVTPEILSEFTVKSALIRDELERLLPSPSLVHNVSHNIIGIAVFIDSDENDVETRQPVGQTVQLLSSRLRAVQDVRCTVSVGGVADGLTHISAEVERAIQRAEHVEPGAFVATSGAEGNGRNGYYYPAETELRLIRTVRAGQADEAREIARELETENLAHRSLSRESIRRLYQEIDATRLKIERRRYNGDGSSFDPDCTASADDRIRYLLDYLVNAADHAAASGPVGSRLKGPIERFVRENALNPEMGLKLLAMHFNLSEVYVSRLFRDSFGENFHSYVESIRMDHATRLLRTTALNVEEIAERVGYQSANTFRRVFKRRFGVSPSAYDAGG